MAGGPGTEIASRKPTEEERSWVAYGAKLREQSAVAYNEAAKVLITSASLFLAFYGTMAKTSGSNASSVSVAVRILPVIAILFGVFSATMVLFPFADKLQKTNVTQIREFVEKGIERKRTWMAVSSISLSLGVVVCIVFLMLY